MSVTGWVVMALQSARMAGIEVPSPVFDRVSKFLDSVAPRRRQPLCLPDASRRHVDADAPRACYAANTWAGRMTIRGSMPGVDYLVNNLPDWDKRNVYYWYYATQVLHHMEGDAWRQWNEVMRKMLPANQETRGKERGSWDPNGDRWRRRRRPALRHLPVDLSCSKSTTATCRSIRPASMKSEP